MDSPTPEEINRRVAEALGATVTWYEALFNGPKGWKLRQPATRAWWKDAMQDADSWQEDGLYMTEEHAWSKVHNFCRDSRAADLVIAEIERRGGDVDFFNRQWLGERQKGADVRFGTGKWHRGESPILWTALCLAFLAAHDASKEAGQ